jgi:hypothetical protein
VVSGRLLKWPNKPVNVSGLRGPSPGHQRATTIGGSALWPACGFRLPRFPRKIGRDVIRRESRESSSRGAQSVNAPGHYRSRLQHEGIIAGHHLTLAAKRQVESLLAADPDPLTQHDIASAATWADRWRDANHRRTSK